MSRPATYKFRASDGAPDRYQDRLNVHGWDLAAYRQNPVVLLNHDDRQMPIGRAKVAVEGDALMTEIEFDPNDPVARQVEAKVAGGFLNAVSVRYLMKDFKANSLGGLDSNEQELLEISVVTIPGNQRAVRAKSLGEGDRYISAERVQSAPQIDREKFFKDVAREARSRMNSEANRLGQHAAAAIDMLLAQRGMTPERK